MTTFLFLLPKTSAWPILANIYLLFFIACSTQQPNPNVLIKTELGDIKVELYADKAPLTTQNFLQYVKTSRYKGATFYRTVTTAPDNQPNKPVKIDVIQGGFAIHLGDKTQYAELLPPIAHESTDKTGIKHQDGTISMARDAPGSAQSEFFICVGPQPELDFGGKRNPDGAGFAAFGRVIEGMDIVRKIHVQPNEEQMLDPRIDILSIQVVE